MAILQGLPLAVKALYELKRQGRPGATSACLVVAGGYDKRLAENREHFKEVQQLVHDLHMDGQVCLLSSISSMQERKCHIWTCSDSNCTVQHEFAMSKKACMLLTSGKWWCRVLSDQNCYMLDDTL